ncbi:MAG: T9SS type A sorting domain-containing protein, partial [candidate division KSB1 bacterium]|nr:T9SS type A sorting domain-containing protein [candidate division KSB1 bacterium]
GGGLAVEIATGTTVDFGLSELAGNGLFILNENATLATAHEAGVAGTLKTTGTITFNEGANYIFNGTNAQVTSTLMPAIVKDLVIDNEAGVKLSQPTTINGVLRLKAGEFDNTIPFALGPGGSISFEGGRLKVPTLVDQMAQTIPTEFALHQNYPNPFNPTTTIGFDLPQPVHVTLKIFDIKGQEVAELVNGKHQAGVHKIVWDASNKANGVYFCQLIAGDFKSVRKLILMK